MSVQGCPWIYRDAHESTGMPMSLQGCPRVYRDANILECKVRGQQNLQSFDQISKKISQSHTFFRSKYERLRTESIWFRDWGLDLSSFNLSPPLFSSIKIIEKHVIYFTYLILSHPLQNNRCFFNTHVWIYATQIHLLLQRSIPTSHKTSQTNSFSSNHF